MKREYELNLKAGLETAFINSNLNKNMVSSLFKPQLIYNNYKNGQKVLSSIIEELETCDSFLISVAFITMSGLTTLLQTLRYLEKKGVKGKILTTDYLLFSEPRALEKLSLMDNIELKMYRTKNTNDGFHTKGYVFQKDDVYKIIVGSANLTASALTINKEWNSKIVSLKNGEYTKSVLLEFDSLWNSENSLTFDKFYPSYYQEYQIKKQKIKINNQENIKKIYALEPNSMQKEFIFNIRKLIAENKNRALLISATGTGKTYASAFMIQDLVAKKNNLKILFLVHREQIAKQAKESYEKVFGNSKKMGILSGNQKDTNYDFLFSTIQTISKIENYSQFYNDEFDIIIIDEVHKAGASSYQKIMNYFKPKLYLGMTASPQRTDDFDIYNLFDHNIVQEIRLQQALENDLLCPFHYFGIENLLIDGKAQDLKDFSKIDLNQKVDHIIKEANYYGYSGTRVKGLVFCSNNKEAKDLSQAFNQKGYSTVALSGEDKIEKRLEMINRLVQAEDENHLDYIFTVDIFNEGVDIPEINQIIMLRPTQSPIIFIQQLGRGLRKNKDKEYVVIIDFISNNTNNYMIPMALFGDRSYNKDNLRKIIRESNRIIPGTSTISFDEISKERIYKAIDDSKLNTKHIIDEGYKELKYKLGRIPKPLDYELYDAIDFQCFLNCKGINSYYEYLQTKEDIPKLSTKALKYLQFIGDVFGNGKKISEAIFLELLIKGSKDIFDDLSNKLKDYHLNIDTNLETNLINIFTGKYFVSFNEKKYKNISFIEIKDKGYILSSDFKNELNDKYFKEAIFDLLEYIKYIYLNKYLDLTYELPFKLYAKYSYSDVFRLLNWSKELPSLNVGGYKYDEVTNTLPVFFNYHKEEGIAESINYGDEFINDATFIGYSKPGRTLNSNDMVVFAKAKENNTKIHLFIRKNKDDKEAKEFYYLGRVSINSLEEVIKEATNQKLVKIEYQLDKPVRYDIFDYITKNEVK